MSLTPAILDALVASGATVEQIVAVMKADIAEREKELAEKRRKDAERQRKCRASHSESRNVTVTGCDIADRVSLDKESPPTPPKEINPFPCVSQPRARGWHRLPDDWEPRILPDPVQAKVDLWPPGAIGDELASFRRWAANAEDKNGKGRKLNWDQAWRNWITRRHDERYSKIPANSNCRTGGKSAAAFALLDPDDSPM